MKTDAEKPQFHILEDHLKWYKIQECKIWETLFLWAFGQTVKKKCVKSQKMQNFGTQNWGFTVYGSEHIHMHTLSMSEPTEVTGQLHIALHA